MTGNDGSSYPVVYSHDVIRFYLRGINPLSATDGLLTRSQSAMQDLRDALERADVVVSETRDRRLALSRDIAIQRLFIHGGYGEPRSTGRRFSDPNAALDRWVPLIGWAAEAMRRVAAAVHTPSPAAGLSLAAMLQPYRPAYLQLLLYNPVLSIDSMFFYFGDGWVSAELLALVQHFEPAPCIRVAYNLGQLDGLRDDLLRLVSGIRAALCIVLMLVLAALARRSNIPSFTLLIVAASRRYGRRGEPDGRVVPAHRSLSGIRGEPSVQR